MTNRERVLVLTIIVSVFGFTFFGAINPVDAKGRSQTSINLEIKDDQDSDLYTEYRNRAKSSHESKLIDMLTSVLNMDEREVLDALDGGLSPSDMLSESGLLLSDLSEQYNFEIVHDRFVRFN